MDRFEQITFNYLLDFFRKRFGSVSMARENIVLQSQEVIPKRRNLKGQKKHERIYDKYRLLEQRNALVLKVSTSVTALALIKPRDVFYTTLQEAINNPSYSTQLHDDDYFKNIIVSTEWKEDFLKPKKVYNNHDRASGTTNAFVAPIVATVGAAVLLAVGIVMGLHYRRTSRSSQHLESLSSKKKLQILDAAIEDEESNIMSHKKNSRYSPRQFHFSPCSQAHSVFMFQQNEGLNLTPAEKSFKQIQLKHSNDYNAKEGIKNNSSTSSGISYTDIPPMIVIDNIEPELVATKSVKSDDSKCYSDCSQNDIENNGSSPNGIKVKHIEASSAFAAALTTNEVSELANAFNLLKVIKSYEEPSTVVLSPSSSLISPRLSDGNSPMSSPEKLVGMNNIPPQNSNKKLSTKREGSRNLREKDFTQLFESELKDTGIMSDMKKLKSKSKRLGMRLFLRNKDVDADTAMENRSSFDEASSSTLSNVARDLSDNHPKALNYKISTTPQHSKSLQEKDFAQLFGNKIKNNSVHSDFKKHKFISRRLGIKLFLKSRDINPEEEYQSSFDETFSPTVSPVITRTCSDGDLRNTNAKNEAKTETFTFCTQRRSSLNMDTCIHVGRGGSDIDNNNIQHASATPISNLSVITSSPWLGWSGSHTVSTKEDIGIVKSSRSSSKNLVTGLSSRIDSPTYSNDAFTYHSRGSGSKDSLGAFLHQRTISDMSLGGFRYTFEAPSSGKLGIIIESNASRNSGPTIFTVKDYSPLFGMVEAGDKIVAVDGEDTSHMSTGQVTALLTRKRTEGDQTNRIRITVMSLQEKNGFKHESEVVSLYPKTPTTRAFDMLSCKAETALTPHYILKKSFSFEEKIVESRQDDADDDEEDNDTDLEREDGYHLLGAIPPSEDDENDEIIDEDYHVSTFDQIM